MPVKLNETEIGVLLPKQKLRLKRSAVQLMLKGTWRDIRRPPQKDHWRLAKDEGMTYLTRKPTKDEPKEE